MELLVGMTLPGLVIVLFALGVYELVASKRKHRHGTAMAATGFDILQEALYPSKRYEVEQREHDSLVYEEDGEAAPPKVRIDLDRATAHIRRG